MTDGEELVAKKAELWKSKLLDISNRNPLIRYRNLKGSTLTVSLPDAITLYRDLDQGKHFTIVTDIESQQDERNGRLHVIAHEDVSADRVLYNLRNRSRTYRFEHGVNILFVAFGSLLWKEQPGSEEFNESPLFLVPVSLERQSSFSPYQLVPVDEDSVFNPSLRKRLEMDFRVKLPEFDHDNGFDLTAALEAVRSAVPPGSGWKVTFTSYIALFHFAKLLMYADLDSGIATLASSPVVRALSGDPSALPPEPSGMPSPQEYDAVLRPEDSFQVLDADSSQQEAVQAALAGVSFVLQGPPGTGKSQTITNMMAELMARGKRILFVSQKMAALDVVRGNLEKCGLGDRCLELHDPKRNRADIIKEIADGLEATSKGAGGASDIRELTAVRHELSDYVRALHAPRGRLQGMTVFKMIGAYSALQEAPELNFQLPGILDVDDEKLSRMEWDLQRLSQMAVAFREKAHPWRGVRPVEWSDRLQAKVQEELAMAMETGNKLIEVLPAASSILGLPTPDTLSDVYRLRQLYRDLNERPQIDKGWLQKDLGSLVVSAQEGSAAFSDLSILEKGLLGMGSRDILDLDGKTFKQSFDVEYAGGMRALNGNYRRDMKILQTIAKRKMTYVEAKHMVGAVDRYQRSMSTWKLKREELLTALKGSFNGEGAELPGLVERLMWARTFRSTHAMLLTPQVQDAVSSVTLPREVSDAGVDIELNLGRFESALNVFIERLYPDRKVNGRPIRDASLKDLASWADKAWEGRYRLQEWLDLTSLLEGMEAMGLADMLRTIREGDVSAQNMLPAFERRFRRLWTEDALASEPSLHRFRRDHQMDLIVKFNELDRSYVENSRQRVQARIEENVRQRREGPEKILLQKQETEIARLSKLKRQRKAVKTMLSECWDLIGLVKPCILMSPLSVAQFLDRERTRFDVIIFDEASQICPEDAIGSIARGKQVIVVGDSRQMPPTSFFALSADDEDEEPDLESILDECETCGMSRRMLMWHYRSRDESLIAFSNHQFYGGRLNTFPSSIFGREGYGVHHVFVPNGIFDSGRTRTNREEARTVAKMVQEHYARKDGRSLGVIAFSEAQMEAVDQELNELRRQDRELDEKLGDDEGEPFLLYNLENVQGHERDRIILSVGYGRDEKGRFLLNFGPLNKDGGERRLNVAITRAKQSLDIVSSIHSEDIDIGSAKSKGASLLRQYLAFAESGGDRRALPMSSGQTAWEVPSPFEEQLSKALEAKGHVIKRDVGTSDYRVDIAIEDPKEPGRFLLGIECDGAHYLSGRTVRDRDRIRQRQLERLGWKLHRVWSTEWFRNPDGELEKIEAALDMLK